MNWWMKILLDELENIGWKIARHQIFIQHDFFYFFLRSVKPIQHFIQLGIFVVLDDMFDRLKF